MNFSLWSCKQKTFYDIVETGWFKWFVSRAININWEYNNKSVNIARRVFTIKLTPISSGNVIDHTKVNYISCSNLPLPSRGCRRPTCSWTDSVSWPSFCPAARSCSASGRCPRAGSSRAEFVGVRLWTNCKPGWEKICNLLLLKITKLRIIHLTCNTVRSESWDSVTFSASLGYALYRCSYSHRFNILTEWAGRLPRFFRMAIGVCCEPSPYEFSADQITTLLGS